jgi:hypothetical protein
MECECRRGRVITRQAITKVSSMQLLQIGGERRSLSSGEAWHETGAIYKADRTPGPPGQPPSLTSHPPRGDLLLAWTPAVPPGTALLARLIAHQRLPHHASLCRVHPPPASTDAVGLREIERCVSLRLPAFARLHERNRFHWKVTCAYHKRELSCVVHVLQRIHSTVFETEHGFSNCRR